MLLSFLKGQISHKKAQELQTAKVLTRATPLLSRGEVAAPVTKSREASLAAADGVVLVNQFVCWTSTTPSAPSKVASRHLLDVAATPPRLRRGVLFSCGFAAINLVVVLALFGVGTLSGQERKYVVGTSINLVGGVANRLPGSLGGPSSQSQSLFFYYGGYPSINIASTGARSLWNASYGFGVNRTESGSKLHSNSHSASIGLSSSLSSKWKISLSDSFQMSNDTSSFNAFRGVALPVEDFRFVFDPVAIRTVSQSNNASINADYSMTGKSSVSFGGSHSFRNYDSTGFNGSLSDQQRMSASLTYNRRTGTAEVWSIGYTGSYFAYAGFQNSFSNRGHVGYSNRIARDLTLQLTVGASRVRNLETQDSYVGYNTSATLQKTIQNSSFSLSYTQTSGESSGLGSISDTRNAGFSLRHSGRSASITANVSAFDTRARLDNTFSTKGVQGNVSIGVRLTRMVSFQGGVMYQHYDQSSPYGFDQKRAFLSIQYDNPTLIRFAR